MPDLFRLDSFHAKLSAFRYGSYWRDSYLVRGLDRPTCLLHRVIVLSFIYCIGLSPCLLDRVIVLSISPAQGHRSVYIYYALSTAQGHRPV